MPWGQTARALTAESTGVGRRDPGQAGQEQGDQILWPREIGLGSAERDEAVQGRPQRGGIAGGVGTGRDSVGDAVRDAVDEDAEGRLTGGAAQLVDPALERAARADPAEQHPVALRAFQPEGDIGPDAGLQPAEAARLLLARLADGAAQ